jgi:peptide deformylase
MAIKKIIRFPSTSLRSVCRPVDLSTDREALLEHVGDLKDTLAVTPNGLALASNQILPLGYRVFVVKQPSQLPEVIINPTYISSQDGVGIDAEGCLSIPELSLGVPRLRHIELIWNDINGVEHTSAFSGLEARIVQHECEHLDGKLIFDYATKKTQIAVRAAAIKNRKAGK